MNAIQQQMIIEAARAARRSDVPPHVSLRARAHGHVCGAILHLEAALSLLDGLGETALELDLARIAKALHRRTPDYRP
jgi:hypothetical protein